MSKPKTKRALPANEAKATTRSIRINTRKLNDVAAEIRGMKVQRALAHLQFSPRRIAKDVNNLIVAEAWTGKNLVMKRWFPDARGRVGHIHKFFSELTIVVREVSPEAKEAA